MTCSKLALRSGSEAENFLEEEGKESENIEEETVVQDEPKHEMPTDSHMAPNMESHSMHEEEEKPERYEEKCDMAEVVEATHCRADCPSLDFDCSQVDGMGWEVAAFSMG